jgi:hypothetical protein
MQKLRNDNVSFDTGVDGKAKTFLKMEGSETVKEPRIITQYETATCLALSAYTYAFKAQVLKQQHWYAPGWTPVQTTNKIAEYRRKAGKRKLDINMTDQSRMDGHWSKFMREFEVEMYGGYFGEEVVKLLEAEVGMPVKSKHGLKGVTSNARGSGSAITTDANTVGLAFMTYVVHRESGCTVKESWARIGPKVETIL